MKNAEVWAQYKDYTRDITEFSRKLGFAGAAICWVLKLPDGSFSECTLYALAFFVLFFVADTLQGLAGALMLRTWIRSEEKKKYSETNTIEGEYDKPPWLDYPAFTLFLLKIVALLIGFAFVGLSIIGE